LFLNQKEAKVKDEQIEDTLDDAIGYLAIWKAYREWKRQQFNDNKPPDPPEGDKKKVALWDEPCVCGHLKFEHRIIKGCPENCIMHVPHQKEYRPCNACISCSNFTLDEKGKEI
jgi:hypothetical protein